MSDTFSFSGSAFGLQAYLDAKQRVALAERVEGHIVQRDVTRTIDAPFNDFITGFADRVGCRVTSLTPHSAILSADNCYIYAYSWGTTPRSCEIDSLATPQRCDAIADIFKAMTGPKQPSVAWNFMAKGERKVANVSPRPPRKTFNSFYPFLECSPDEFYDGYLNDPSTLLLLLGEPGTGKTTFITNLIWHLGKDVMFTNDDSIISSDDFFCSFITDRSTGVMVLEDADVMLTAREKSQNAVMKHFLSITDSIVSAPNKKVLISANTIDETLIDTALMRPGRCYRTLRFRPLSYDEAVAACNDAGLTVPSEKRDYTLAELFTGRPQVAVAPRKFGFA